LSYLRTKKVVEWENMCRTRMQAIKAMESGSKQ
jgi:hypothetical protein